MQIWIFADFIDFDEKKVSTVAADSAVAHEMEKCSKAWKNCKMSIENPRIRWAYLYWISIINLVMSRMIASALGDSIEMLCQYCWGGGWS